MLAKRRKKAAKKNACLIFQNNFVITIDNHMTL